MITEKQVGIAAKLYERRDIMRRFWGPRYDQKITEYSDLLRKVMAKRNVGCLEAGLIAAEIVESKIGGGIGGAGMSIALILSASVEMAERVEK